ncbi:UNVERIFIED_CONTAM: hypothetical protein GTU68_035370 [Idotea baltica]|nr:hypothetical protein [Idotea baltica]
MIMGNCRLGGVTYEMPMASAQVKSCLLLAGIYAEGSTTLIESAPTRDHTERMLRSFGYPIEVKNNAITIESGHQLVATHVNIPGDISSAAFFMVAASIAHSANLLLLNVGVNSTRTGVIDILRLMGADIQLENEREIGSEPVADIRVCSAPLKGIDIPEELIPSAIDEFPALFIAAACATGRTLLRGAEELRVKESDRIQVMADGLNILGIHAEPLPDGIVIEGGELHGGHIQSYGDHRIAMAFSIASLRAKAPICVHDCANVTTSFPNFLQVARHVGMHIDEH